MAKTLAPENNKAMTGIIRVVAPEARESRIRKEHAKYHSVHNTEKQDKRKIPEDLSEKYDLNNQTTA